MNPGVNDDLDPRVSPARNRYLDSPLLPHLHAPLSLLLPHAAAAAAAAEFLLAVVLQISQTIRDL